MSDKHEPNSASDTVTTTTTTMDEQRVSSTASETTPAATTVEIQQAAEIERILNTSPLDPYAVLGYKLPYTSIELTSVKAQYRKLSRYVHPDRCKHEQARDAFERLKRADADIEDDEKRTTFLEAVEEAYLEVIYQKNLSARRLQHDQPSTEATAAATTTTTTAQASSKGPSLAALRPANTATNGASSQSLQQQLRNTQAPELGTDKVFDKMVLFVLLR